MRRFPAVLALCFAAAACGRGAVTIAGDLADADGRAPDGVWAVEAGQHAALEDGRFELAGLTPGPATLRLLAGDDTVGVMEIGGVAGGSRLHLGGIRVDPESGRAFPRAVEVEGGGVVLVNGVRHAPEGTLPRRVDAAGTVLAHDIGAGALLVRADDERLPDLRVVVTLETVVETPDGDPVQPALLALHDSVRVEGEARDGYVTAARLVVQREVALRESGRARRADPPPPAAAPARAPAPAAAPARGAEPARAREGPPPSVQEPPGRGRGRGQERGRGRQKEKKKEKG